MKTLKEFQTLGYKFLAYSSNGWFEIVSYLAKLGRGRKSRKVYGYFDYKLNKYVEEPYIPHP